ncbi:hypothetical protein COT42_07245 [Candidatus Saganbacteria bacterium CG08_land_8_20_14_0_20_45_16]|uniref:Uncharacterized protein n=1 Tax=Candidatus Saganbacteria bacterium CG08_land_8_20_14_0_20_45_16 TaxID=2014293 RepID=A0A2H0XUU2_UNCSA|nr:MAG: hypothetical protein COT42_07245 [Candidatus Saganbacteria bacterium CG08_land_8_20_14_0_20_45_16]
MHPLQYYLADSDPDTTDPSHNDPESSDDVAVAQWRSEILDDVAGAMRHRRDTRYAPIYYDQDGNQLVSLDFTQDSRVTSHDLRNIFRDQNMIDSALRGLETAGYIDRDGRVTTTFTGRVDVSRFNIRGFPNYYANDLAGLLQRARNEETTMHNLCQAINNAHIPNLDLVNNLDDLNQLIRNLNFFDLVSQAHLTLPSGQALQELKRLHHSSFSSRSSTTAFADLTELEQAYVMTLNRMLLETLFNHECPQLNPQLTIRPLQDPDTTDHDSDGDRSEYISVSEASAYFMRDEALFHDDMSADYFHRIWQFTRLGLQRDLIPYVWQARSGYHRNSFGGWLPTAMPARLVNAGIAWRFFDDINNFPDGERSLGGILAGVGKQYNGMDAASDDLELASALIYASQFDRASGWQNEQYLTQAQQFLDTAWSSYIIERRPGQFCLAAGDQFIRQGEFNPSYMLFADFQNVFPLIDNHNWPLVGNCGYDLIEQFGTLHLDNTPGPITPIPTDWVGMDRFGDFVPSRVFNTLTTLAAWDAQRVFIRTAMDYAWFGNDRAYHYLHADIPDPNRPECHSTGPLCTYRNILLNNHNTIPALVNYHGQPGERDPEVPQTRDTARQTTFANAAYLLLFYYGGDLSSAMTIYQNLRSMRHCYTAMEVSADHHNYTPHGECDSSNVAEHHVYWDAPAERQYSGPIPGSYYGDSMAILSLFLLANDLPHPIRQGIDNTRATQRQEYLDNKPREPGRVVSAADFVFNGNRGRAAEIFMVLKTADLIDAHSEVTLNQIYTLEDFESFINDHPNLRGLHLRSEERNRALYALQGDTIPIDPNIGMPVYFGRIVRRMLDQNALVDQANIAQLRATLEIITTNPRPTINIERELFLNETSSVRAEIARVDRQHNLQLMPYFADAWSYYNNAAILLAAYTQQAVETDSQEDLRAALNFCQTVREMIGQQEVEEFSADTYNQGRIDLIEAQIRSQIRFLDSNGSISSEELNNLCETHSGAEIFECLLCLGYVNEAGEIQDAFNAGAIDFINSLQANDFSESDARSVYDTLDQVNSPEAAMAFCQIGVEQTINGINSLLLVDTHSAMPDYYSITRALLTLGDLYLRMYDATERAQNPNEYYLDKAFEFYNYVAHLDVTDDSNEESGLEVYTLEENLVISATPAEMLTALRFNYGRDDNNAEIAHLPLAERNLLQGIYISRGQYEDARLALHTQLRGLAMAKLSSLYMRRTGERRLDDVLQQISYCQNAVETLEESGLEDNDFSLVFSRATLTDLNLLLADRMRFYLWPQDQDIASTERSLADLEIIVSNQPLAAQQAARSRLMENLQRERFVNRSDFATFGRRGDEIWQGLLDANYISRARLQLTDFEEIHNSDDQPLSEIIWQLLLTTGHINEHGYLQDRFWDNRETFIADLTSTAILSGQEINCHDLDQVFDILSQNYNTAYLTDRLTEVGRENLRQDNSFLVPVSDEEAAQISRVLEQADQRYSPIEESDLEIVQTIARNYASHETPIPQDQVVAMLSRRISGQAISEADMLQLIQSNITFLEQALENNTDKPSLSVFIMNQLIIVFDLFTQLHPELSHEITPVLESLRTLLANLGRTSPDIERLSHSQMSQRIIQRLSAIVDIINLRIPQLSTNIPRQDQNSRAVQISNYLRYTIRLRSLDIIRQITQRAREVYATTPSEFHYLYDQANTKILEIGVRTGDFMNHEFSYLFPTFTDPILREQPIPAIEFVGVQREYMTALLTLSQATQVTRNQTRRRYEERLVHGGDLEIANRMLTNVIQNSRGLHPPFPTYFRMHARLKQAEIIIRREDNRASARGASHANYEEAIIIFREILQDLSTLSHEDYREMAWRPYSFLAELFHEWANIATAGGPDLATLSLHFCYLSDSEYDYTRRIEVLIPRFTQLNNRDNELKVMIGRNN